MVRFWPWKKDDSSAASFEKTLSTISQKISVTTNKVESQRQRSRRFKALWTLYTSVLYLIYATILAVAVGWKNWGMTQYAALTGGPFIIYAIRFALTAFYDYRISSTQAYLSSLQKQRDATIEKLKVATKYDSTQQLLDKYGGSTPKSTSSNKGQGQAKRKPTAQGTPVQRTGLPPPPTANIPGRMIPSPSPSTPNRSPARDIQNTSPQPVTSPNTPSFAPNAYENNTPQYSTQSSASNWYDRLFDILLGEDESAPKNRIALLCQHCRLVNGQAPPGVKTLDQLGKWRCEGCGGWNGEESEAKRLVEVMREKRELDERDGWKDVSRGEKEDENNNVDERQSSTRRRVLANETRERDEKVHDEVEGSDSEEDEAGPKTRSKSKGKTAKKTE